jgi:hypothetical protein
MTIPGKNIYIYQVDGCHGGDASKIVADLVAGQFQSVILHSTNVGNWRTNARVRLAHALQAAGIAVFGGCAVYGADPYGEGKQAGLICKDLSLAGWVFDAEAKFDVCDHPDSAAVHVLQEFSNHAQPGALKGWCWWALPHAPGKPASEYHPNSILRVAMKVAYGDADFGLPMMYWSWGDSAVDAMRYLDESWYQWREITNKPIVPIGRAYIGDGGTAKPMAITAFDEHARKLGAVGVSWWSMQHALDAVHLPGVWDALVALKPFGEVTAPVPDPVPMPAPLTVEARLSALEAQVKAHWGPA